MKLNNKRNKLDFTHSKTKLILASNWEKNRDHDKAKEDCYEMFNFIYVLIKRIYSN